MAQAQDKVFKVLFWNVRGLNHRKSELQHLLKRHNPDTFTICETMITDHSSVRFSGYRLHYVDALYHNGGILTGVKESLPSNMDYPHPSGSILRVDVQKSSTVFSTFGVYSSQSHDVNIALAAIPTATHRCVLQGDFNGHHTSWHSLHNDYRGHRIFDGLVHDKDWNNINSDKPTFFSARHGTTTTIDLTFASADLLLEAHHEVIDWGSSDHWPTVTTFGTPGTQSRPSRPFWNFRAVDWPMFKAHADAAFKDQNMSDLPLELSVQNFHNNVQGVCSAVVPRTHECAQANPFPPWWNREVCLSIATMKKARNKARRSKIPADLAAFRIAYALHKRTIRLAKRNSWKEFCSRISPRTSLSKVWSMARSDSRLPRSIPAIRDPSTGNVIFDDATRAARIMDSFYVTSPPTSMPSLQTITPVYDGLSQPFILNELEAAILASPNTSPGPDKISYKMIRNLPDSAKLSLLNIYNASLESGVIPSPWTVSKVIALLKPDKDPQLVSSYRPIALSSCLLKIMERMILRRLDWHLWSTNQVNTNQFGFLKGRSSPECALQVINTIIKAVNKRNFVVVAFLDLRKAFDYVSHSAIIGKTL